tara:strand:+ start:1218 stop:1457 length:240 start_codon:yes stop_codon:yes gene_type:complete
MKIIKTIFIIFSLVFLASVIFAYPGWTISLIVLMLIVAIVSSGESAEEKIEREENEIEAKRQIAYEKVLHDERRKLKKT